MASTLGVRVTRHAGPYPVGLDFLRQIAFPDGYHGCWEWTGPVNGERGYGRYGRLFAGRVALAGGVDACSTERRRVVYTCGNHRCVHPDPRHLHWAT